MGYDPSIGLSAGASGAKMGSAFGPWGTAIGGGIGLLSGFMGGGDPEEYGADQYAQDIAPYQNQVDEYRQTSIGMMNPNSSINRMMTQNTMNNSMDLMGTSNTINQRNNAMNPYIGSSGINQQQQQNSLLNYANMGLQQNMYDESRRNQTMSGLGQAAGMDWKTMFSKT